MEPRIETLSVKKLIGQRTQMSLLHNKTFDLWSSFMPRRSEIKNKISDDLFSVRLYNIPSDIYKADKEFEKWAAVEVSNFNAIPKDMEALTLQGGLYAVFMYKGSSTDPSIFQYIYGEWLPDSNFILDNKPHFEIMGKKYKNASADSEEEIWIPVISKSVSSI